MRWFSWTTCVLTTIGNRANAGESPLERAGGRQDQRGKEPSNSPVPRDVLILWHEGDAVRCTRDGIPGIGRFLLHCGEDVVVAEPVHAGAAASARSESLLNAYPRRYPSRLN